MTQEEFLQEYEDKLAALGVYPDGELARRMDAEEDRIRSRWPADSQNEPLPDWAKVQIAKRI